MMRDVDLRHAADVRTRLLRAPWWALGIITGLPFAAVMVVVNLLDGGSVVAGVVASVVGGVVFGVFMGLFQARMNRGVRASMDLPDDREADALRAAMKGPRPADPETRAAAARLVAHQLDQARRTQWWSIVVFSALLLLGVWLALTSSPWWWCAVVFWCGFIVWTVRIPSRLRRRLALLDS